MKQKKLRGLFSLKQHWSKCVMGWNEDWRNGKWKMKKGKLFLESDFWRSKQDHSLKSIFWKAWSCKSTTSEAINARWRIARSIRILLELRPETIATYHKSARLWLKAVGAMPVYTLIEDQATQVNSRGLYSQQVLHQGFFVGENIRGFQIVTSVNEKSCSIFIVVVHGPFQ